MHQKNLCRNHFFAFGSFASWLSKYSRPTTSYMIMANLLKSAISSSLKINVILSFGILCFLSKWAHKL